LHQARPLLALLGMCAPIDHVMHLRARLWDLLRRVGQHGNVGTALDKDSIGRIIKRLVKRAKLSDPGAYGGHSLRAGFVTEASANGATDRQIMKQTGHKSIVMVHRYAREDQKDRQDAASKLGL